MWIPATRRRHSRCGLRYETDLTDVEWAVIEPRLPPPCRGGRPRGWSFRDVLDTIFHVSRGGVAWRLLPNDLPPKSTAFRWFATWRGSGLFEAINHSLVMADRERVGREASPTAVVLDSQSVRTTASGGPFGFDAGKKLKDGKPNVMVDNDDRQPMRPAHSIGASEMSLPSSPRGKANRASATTPVAEPSSRV